MSVSRHPKKPDVPDPPPAALPKGELVDGEDPGKLSGDVLPKDVPSADFSDGGASAAAMHAEAFNGPLTAADLQGIFVPARPANMGIADYAVLALAERALQEAAYYLLALRAHHKLPWNISADVGEQLQNLVEALECGAHQQSREGALLNTQTLSLIAPRDCKAYRS